MNHRPRPRQVLRQDPVRRRHRHHLHLPHHRHLFPVVNAMIVTAVVSVIVERMRVVNVINDLVLQIVVKKIGKKKVDIAKNVPDRLIIVININRQGVNFILFIFCVLLLYVRSFSVFFIKNMN